MLRQHGFTLYEVLICLILFTLTLASVSGKSSRYMQAARSMEYLQRAAFEAETMAEFISAHQQRLNDYEQHWRHEIESSLPDGKGEVSENNRVFRIVVRWGGYRGMCQKNLTGMSGCVNTQAMINLV